jgi:2-dehydro-3-deoxyphosphogluconate aldolase / (4S)-4-hydroxy-2-oxoglutarate aldolase
VHDATGLAPSALRDGPVATAIRDARLIAVLRWVEPRQRLLALVDDLLADGVRILEITLDRTEAEADLAAVIDAVGARAVVGAGTVRSIRDLDVARSSGAAFAVAPVLDLEVLDAALSAGMLFVPGAYTPTEADRAWRAGATFVKLFPGSSLGAAHIRELGGPLPEIETIVTGGVDAANAGDFLRAGAVAVGMGSALVPMERPARRALVAQLRGTG